MSLNQQEQKKLNEVITHLEKEENITLSNHAKQDPQGLGDTLEKVFTKFGITEEFIKKSFGLKGCGCQKRKQFLNKIFPYRKSSKKYGQGTVDVSKYE
jgi:hypothetical protein